MNAAFIFLFNLRILYQKFFLTKPFFRIEKRGLTQTHCGKRQVQRSFSLSFLTLFLRLIFEYHTDIY